MRQREQVLPSPADAPKPYAEPQAGQQPPVVIVERPTPRRDPLDRALRLLMGIALLLGVALLGTLLLLTVLVANQAGVLGRQLGGGLESAATVLGRAIQSTADRLDPAHPPRDPLVQDTEFSELRRVSAGQELGRAGGYVLTLTAIRKRAGASTADEAQYAVILRRLETPREQRVLGITVRQDWDEAEYVLYKGESFRLGRAYYKVNWLSVEQQDLAIGRYRTPDTVTAPLKIELD